MGNFKYLKGYQVIPNDLIFDNSLSDRARFLYCYMASKPEGWNFFLEPMAKEIGYSVETLRKYIKELVNSGWLIRGKQDVSKSGKFGAVTYTLLGDKPYDKEEDEVDRMGISPCRKKPVSVKNRDGKIPTQYNIDNKDNIDTINNIDEDEVTVNEKDTNFYNKSYSLETINAWLSNDKKWQGAVAQSMQISVAEVAEQISVFIAHLKANGCIRKNGADVKPHFTNWLRKTKARKYENNSTNQTGRTGERNATDEDMLQWAREVFSENG